jgi:hypothetical protein
LHSVIDSHLALGHYPLSAGELDKFVLCVPYFITQATWNIFIRLVASNQTMISAPFSMRLCSLLVSLFSGVQPIDTMLTSPLSFFFRFPTQADESDQIVKTEDDTFENVKLLIEDINAD